jgi:hypothetical protein
VRIKISPSMIGDYRRFLDIKKLPIYRFCGEWAEFPDEYAKRIGVSVVEQTDTLYQPISGLFDYQRDISALAIRKRKFAAFLDCGLGKTLIFLEFCRHALAELPADKCALIISPLMVVKQTIAEAKRFYGDFAPERIVAKDLAEWIVNSKSRFGITNYDALADEIPQGRIGCLILDESSMLKSHYGKWGQTCIRLGRGVDWKLCCTGTPAPNDRIEYANHAVFLDQYPNTNSFLARYFINRGQTQERWALKPHAIESFYRSLSHWCIFMANPATYGWKDNCGTIPPIHIHIDPVNLTTQQRDMVMDKTGSLFAGHWSGGITSRSTLSQIAKGNAKGTAIATLKPAFIRHMVDSWPDESTIIWCHYNREQKTMEAAFPDAASISGDTLENERMRIIDEFKEGRIKVLITKPKILGFGLNLQVCTRQVFSGLQDSYEEFYQAVKRSNRIGSTRPLNVHIPVTEVERPMIETVLNKAKRVQLDTEEQEAIFRKSITGVNCVA